MVTGYTNLTVHMSKNLLKGVPPAPSDGPPDLSRDTIAIRAHFDETRRFLVHVNCNWDEKSTCGLRIDYIYRDTPRLALTLTKCTPNGAFLRPN